MVAALVRNVYATAAVTDEQSHALARYVLTADAALAAQATTAIQAGDIHWPQVPILQSEAA